MIITQTPLRISFVGGGTDFRGFYEKEYGSVVSTAIDKYIYVVVKKRFDNKIRVSYTKTEMTDSVDEIQHELVRESLKMTGVCKGVEISTLADIPSEGTGLGSSSALTVGLLNALYAFKGETVTAEQLAQQACRIEIDILDKPIGKQDQYIAAYGGLRHFMFLENDEVVSKHVAASDSIRQRLSENLLLFYTGMTRQAPDILVEQKSNIADKRKVLARMRDQADRLAWDFAKNNISSLGSLLNDGWSLKKQLASGISNPQIDNIYDMAISAGAIGGKVTGAGGGGFFLFYVPPSRRESVRIKLSHLQELPFSLEQDGSKVIFNIN